VRPSVAVVPFGATGPDRRTGAFARQIARRLVLRLADESAIEIRPVFLVSVPEESNTEGYVVIGSTPDPDLAAGYGASLGASHALVGTLRNAVERSLEVSLVDVSAKTAVRAESLPIPAGELQQVEPALAGWLGHALALELADPRTPAATTEPAYAALLLGMEAELNAALLASGSAETAVEAKLEALERYAECLREDPSCDAAEERLLVMAAESLGTGLEDRHIAALESLCEVRRSWKGHYLLGELRRSTGDASGAVVALEHSDALHPLGPEAAVRLAELYLEAGAERSAAARLRRVRRALGSDAPADTRLLLARALIRIGDREDAQVELERIIASEGPGAAAANGRRLRLGLAHPDLERVLERAGSLALEAPDGSLDAARTAFEDVLAADPGLWEAHFGLGLIARRRGDAEGAMLAFRRALDLWPAHPDATHELGVTLLMAGSTEDAAHTLDLASGSRPDDFGYLADAGLAQLRAGRLDEARQRLERAAAMEPTDPITRAYLAELERVEAEIGKGR